MNTKHTRGPWHWDSDPIKGDPLGRVRYRVTALGKTVTQCYYSSGDASAEHDARLIAAAPELYDAADNALNALIGCCVAGDGVDDRKTMLEAKAMLRAALAKATGEAS